MSNFRTKLLGLAAFATVFVGASYGQAITACTAGTNPTTQTTSPGPTSLRAEGTTELVGDILFYCNNGGALGTGSLQSFLSGPVTSKLNSNDTTATGPLTEASLFLCAGVTTACNNVLADFVAYGTVSGNAVTFSNIPIPAGNFSGRISNIRINASAVTLASTLTTVTEQVLVSANDTSAATASTTAVAYVFKSLVTPALLANPNGNPSATLTAYTTCSGNALPSTGNLTKSSFAVTVAETFGGAFKTKTGAGLSASESGSYQPADGSTAGAASFGTRIALTFSGVPTGTTLYLPTTVSLGANFTMALTVSTAGDVTASTTTGAPPAEAAGFYSSFPATETTGASAAYTPTSGTVTAVYEVTVDNKANIDAVDVPVYVTYAAGAYTTAQGPITVLETYWPMAAAASATTIPNFAPVTTGALTATSIATCATNLLFPYLTNTFGFDTGIDIADTSSDPFVTASSPGTCTLNFYGTGAPSPATGIAAPGGSLVGGGSTAFLLSSVAPGFTGYMIATCNFQYGHGFAYLAYDLSQNNGTSMGYLAEVIANRATGAAPAETPTF